MYNSAEQSSITIAGERYSQRRVYIIAEIGSNHNQDLDTALHMIEAAAKIGVNAVKFQSIKFADLYNPELEDESLKRWFDAIELDEKWYPVLAAKCRALNVDFLSAPTYEGALELLEACNVPAYKIASPQAQANLPLVKKVAELAKPMFISMGYGTYTDIEAVIKCCESAGNRSLIPLHCVSQYPVRPADANLHFMPTLSAMTGYPVGFSDHSAGDELAIAAVSLGACVIEKHVTFDRDLPGPDHKFSMLFNEFEQMIKRIRNVEQALGHSRRLALSQEEGGYRTFVALKLLAKHKIAAGKSLEPEDFILRRSNNDGVLAEDLSTIARCSSLVDLNQGELLQWQHLKLEHRHDR
jgi:sialic acid synthase SpsE